jgi:hypothetical protein
MTGSLRPALDPGSIGVIGAPENSNKIGGRPLFYLGKSGYAGRRCIQDGATVLRLGLGQATRLVIGCGSATKL